MLIPALVSVTYLVIPSLAKSPPDRPLKVIAPDLIIESAEQGAFYDKNYVSAQDIDPRNFKALNVVPRPHSFMFGWRMKVKTTRKSILVQERTVDGKGKQGLPFHATPRFGYICNCTDIVQGVGPGKDSTTVYVEHVPVVTFTATIK
jgi:hypothetical protein